MKINTPQVGLTMVLTVLLTGCGSYRHNPKDPLERVNRVMNGANLVVNTMYINPVVKSYEKVVPSPYRKSIHNGLANFAEVPTSINLVLQGKPGQAIKSIWRLVINSTLGVFGMFDIASEMGLTREQEDLGLTFARWGWRESTYVVLPIIGPSTFRDGLGWFGNSYFSVPQYLEPGARNGFYLAHLLQRKSEMKDVERVVGAAGVDNYNLIRNGYLQNRAFQMNDGQVPPDQFHPQHDSVHLGEPPE